MLLQGSILSACGGGGRFPPTVKGVNVQSVQYGKPAIICVGYKDWRSSFSVDVFGVRTNLNFASYINSLTDILVLNCEAKQAGDFSLAIQRPNSKTI